MFARSVATLFLLFTLHLVSCQNRECSRSDGVVGSCVRRNECSSLLKRLENVTSAEQKEILISVRCTTTRRDRRPLVCCPYEHELTESPPTILGHQNLRLLPQHCSESFDDRLYGGKLTSIHEYRWMALFSYITGNRRDFECGGSIINEKYILTAAHCVTNFRQPDKRLIGVRLGEHDIASIRDCEKTAAGEECNPPVQDMHVEKIIPHPGYIGYKPARSPDWHNDIALVRVKGTIDLTRENIETICLPTTAARQNMNLTGIKLDIGGWGRTNIDENGNIVEFQRDAKRSLKLQQISIPYVSNLECGNIYNSSLVGGITTTQLCAGGEKGISTCDADSGGPLTTQVFDDGVVDLVQFGVLSAGSTECGQHMRPAIFTRVSYYMQWILDQLEP